MTRHWVYWRSGIAGDERIWATLLDPDGLHHTRRDLFPEHRQVRVPGQPDGWYAWRISKAEAERLAAAARQKAGQP